MRTPNWFDRLVAKSSGRDLSEFRVLDEFYKETSTVKHDRFDAMQYDGILSKSEALEEIIKERAGDNESWSDAVKDDYLSLYKAVPKLRTADEIKPTHRINHTAMSKMMETKEFDELRTYTELDEWASAMGAVASATLLGEYFDEAKDLMAQQEKMEEADENLEDTMKSLEDMADQDELEEQELQDALDNLQDQLKDYEEQIGDLQEQIDGNAKDIRSAARGAAKGAKGEAEDLQAAVATFGTDAGALRRMPAKNRMELASRIARSRKLRKLADLAGRMKRFAWGEQARKMTHGVDEIHDISQGNDINRVLPVELAALADPDTELLFYKRFIEKQLMQYELRGQEKVARGAIICLIDNSGSMTGDREMWAKAVGLALLDVAHKQGRDFYGIHFSSAYDDLQEFHFVKGDTSDINQVLDFAEYFIGGGTDFEKPLSRAVEVLEAQFSDENAQKGDIIMITDGESRVSDEWLARFDNSKEAIGFRLYGLLIGSYGQLLKEMSDTFLTIGDLTKGDDAKEVFGYV